MKKKVLILFGGKSCEHDISIISTFQVLKNFNEYLYEIYLVYIDKNGKWKFVEDRDLNMFLIKREKYCLVQLGVNENVLYKQKRNGKYCKLSEINVVFPILHGINGEDGSVAGLLKLSNIPFVGCDHISAGIGIDKSLFKKCISSLPNLKYFEVSFNDLNEDKLIKRIREEIGFPCIIKPSMLGSSIGINICKNEENLINLLKKSLNFDKKVIIEPFVENLREFNVALFSYCGEIILSEIEEPLLKEKILTFSDKYMNFSGQKVDKNIPAKLNKKLKEDLINIAKECYLKCGCSGVVRIDFIYDSDKKILYVNEMNTIPGALGLYLFEANNIERNDVINKLIYESLRVYNSQKNIQTEYVSEVLKNKNLSKFSR